MDIPEKMETHVPENLWALVRKEPVWFRYLMAFFLVAAFLATWNDPTESTTYKVVFLTIALAFMVIVAFCMNLFVKRRHKEAQLRLNAD